MLVEITLTHDIEAFKSLRDEWEALHKQSSAGGITLSWTWIDVWWKHFHDVGELWLMIARWREDNQLLGIAPMMLSYIQPNVGPIWKRLEFIGSSHFHEHLDFIIKQGYEEQIAGLFISKLMEHKNRWDMIRLARLCDTATIDFLQNSSDGWQENPRQAIVSPYIQLPDNIDDWMSMLSKNRRKKQRRYLRYLDETYPDNWSITLVREHDHLDRVFDELVELHQSKWEETNKQGAFYQYGDLRAYYRDLMHALLDNDCLRMLHMVVDGETVVVLFAYHYHGRTYDQVSGLHEISSDVPVGHVVTQYSIAQAIDDSAVEYSFMWGEEPYKYSFAANNRVQHTFDLIGASRVQLHKKTALLLRTIKSNVRKTGEFLIARNNDDDED